MKEIIPQERITRRILFIRRQKVMLDRDLAELYGVKTKYINQQVRRNIKRFPEEFMFRLSIEERNELVAICNRFQTMKHSSALPCVFTIQALKEFLEPSPVPVKPLIGFKREQV